MKKLKLQVDDLAVESFVADAREARIGTVEGHDFTLHCGGSDLCTVSCNGTCYGSCDGHTCNTIEYNSCGGGCNTQDILCTASAGTSCNEPCPSCMPEYC